MVFKLWNVSIFLKYPNTKNACDSMDRASACWKEGFRFEFYWAQVSAGGFLDYVHPLYSLLTGNKVWFVHIFQEKKIHLNSTLYGILEVSFTFTFTHIQSEIVRDRLRLSYFMFSTLNSSLHSFILHFVLAETNSQV